MTAKVTRTRHHRRDRRKAKATGYARQGKIGMGSRVGHGTYGKGRPGSVGNQWKKVKNGKKDAKAKSAENPHPSPSRLVNVGDAINKEGNMEIEQFRRHSKVCGNSECRDLSPRGKDLEEANQLAIEAGWGMIDDVWFCPKHQDINDGGGDDYLLRLLIEAMSIPPQEDVPDNIAESLNNIFAFARGEAVMREKDIDRKSFFSDLIAKTNVFLRVFPHPELQIPKDLEFPVTLEYGLNMLNPIHDLKLEDSGIRATLSFNRTPIPTFVPWTSIGGMRGGNGFTLYWADAQQSMPIEKISPTVSVVTVRASDGPDNSTCLERPKLSLVPEDKGDK